MNELEFLRSQLRLEQTHLDSSRELLRRTSRHTAVDGPVIATREAALAHLAFALQKAMERCRVHTQLLAERTARNPHSAEERLAVLDAVAAVQSALGPAASTLDGLSAEDALQLAQRISTSNAALEPWCSRLYDLSDWRRAARIDAEAVFEERRLHEVAMDRARLAGLLE